LSQRPRRTIVAIAGILAIAASLAASPIVAASGLPTGEHHFGNVTIEPAYNDATGDIIYLLTPDKAPFPSHTNQHSVAPLYMVMYPPGTDWTLNCEGVPGNCPDHDLLAAGAATTIMPQVYGDNPYAVPGHDHLVDVPGGEDFNVPWHVYIELFTSKAAVRHITTDAELDAAKKSGDVIEIDSHLEFLCSVVSARTYMRGTPVGG
jgi:hypothetical protein